MMGTRPYFRLAPDLLDFSVLGKFLARHFIRVLGTCANQPIKGTALQFVASFGHPEILPQGAENRTD
jgi:hypothetical protein